MSDGYTSRVTADYRIARAFHETYEGLAPAYHYKTRKGSAVPWEDVPEKNKGLMCATVRRLIRDGVISVPTG